jgi:hypothetical protein
MYDKDLTIFSVFHKEYPAPNCSFIKPIQVGKTQNQVDLPFLSDDTEDNISDKNVRFSEATALYWIWKNLHHIKSKYIGLAHYRRYLTIPETRTKRKLWTSKTIEDKSDVYTRSLSTEEINNISSPAIKNYILAKLGQSEILLAKASHIGNIGGHLLTIKDQFIYNHLIDDWLIFERTLQKLVPEDYEFAKTLFTSKNLMHCYNMFVADKSFIDDYCTWLFPILFELEKNIKLSPYPYQNRSVAFLSERLLNLYVYKTSMRITEMPIVYFT